VETSWRVLLTGCQPGGCCPGVRETGLAAALAVLCRNTAPAAAEAVIVFSDAVVTYKE